jgi:hypothetical protein
MAHWRSYIKISDQYSVEHVALLEKELDDFWQEVPEFREIATLAAQKMRTKGKDYIIIEPRSVDSVSELSDNVNLETGVINLYIPESCKIHEEYLGTDKEWHDFSFKRTILHELIHLTDPALEFAIAQTHSIHAQADITEDSLDANYIRSVANDTFEKVKKEVFEPWTVARENIIMHRHYGEPFRVRWENSTRSKEISGEQESGVSERQQTTVFPVPIADFSGKNERYSFCGMVIPDEGKRIDNIGIVNNR